LASQPNSAAGGADDDPGHSERLAIAGAGAVACGLAVTAAPHGEVVLWARSEESAARARAEIDKGCNRAGHAWASARVRITSELDDLASASFAIEAIAEDPDHKGELLATLGEHLAPDEILATTTSSLSIEQLAQASGRPQRFVGLHVFNPVPRMALIELVFPAAAAQRTRERARALCNVLGKTAVEVPDTPGFVVNRLLFPYLFDAVRLLEQTGIAPEDLDTCMRLGAGHPMGPLALLDLIGLDVAIAIGEEIGVEIPERLRELVAQGALGRKSDRGLTTR
jgi:3-hydroxybutyryl-CoA dehydrogenase